MCCEPTLQVWVSELLAVVGVVQEAQKAGEKPTAGSKPADPGDQQADLIDEHTRSAMDTLRLCVTYLVFDVQATHREIRCLRKMLEQHKANDGET
jgi:hypothetical protein